MAKTAKLTEKQQRFVDEYIANTKIKVGGDYWGDTEEKEYTVEQYIKKELKERLDSKKLRAKKKGHTSSYNDDFENVSFEEYINRQFDFDDMIKKDIDKFVGFNLRNLSQLRFKDYKQLVDGLVDRLEKHYGV